MARYATYRIASSRLRAMLGTKMCGAWNEVDSRPCWVGVPWKWENPMNFDDGVMIVMIPSVDERHQLHMRHLDYTEDQ